MKSYCVDRPNCETYSKNQIMEYSFKEFDINDNVIVLLNISKQLPILGYRKNNIWYDDFDKPIDCNYDDIISFVQPNTIFKFHRKWKS